MNGWTDWILVRGIGVSALRVLRTREGRAWGQAERGSFSWGTDVERRVERYSHRMRSGALDELDLDRSTLSTRQGDLGHPGGGLADVRQFEGNH